MNTIKHARLAEALETIEQVIEYTKDKHLESVAINLHRAKNYLKSAMKALDESID